MTEFATGPDGRASADELVVDHMATVGFDDLPIATVHKTKLLVLDTLGAALAAFGAEGCDALHLVAAGWGGTEEATVLGYGTRVPAPSAALVNATLARALEIDDVHETALVHATATIVPVALAVAEQVGGVDGRAFLTSVAAGIDLSCRLAQSPTIALGGEAYRPRSMSYTYQTGTLSGSLVAARLAGLSRQAMADAFGIGYSQCAGNLQGLVEGSLMVRVQQGICAQAAVVAMELARAGINGTKQSLEGIYGWYQAFYGGHYDRQILLDGLGHRFEVDGVSVKPYACCKYGHTFIAAAVEVAEDPAFDLDRLRRATVTVGSQDCWDLICAPLEVKSSPEALAGAHGWILAQFSLPFMVACGLARGRLGIADLTPEARTDPQLLDVLAKVCLVLEDRTTATAELPEPGVVSAEMQDGSHIARRVTHAVGHPQRPMTTEQQREKFRWCTAGMRRADAEGLMDAVLGLEEIEDVSVLLGGAVRR